MIQLEGKRIVVTGGGGFLGKHVVEKLRERQVTTIVVPRSSDYDLREREACEEIVKDAEIVIHLAAQIGGIGFIKKIPGEIFYNNAVMGIEMMEAARKSGVKKFVSIGTVCEYPKLTPLPFKEEYLWDGYPEETTAPYGIAKKLLITQGEAYRQQYGFNTIHLLPVNLYGSGDNFDRELAHVIPALIKRILEARDRGDQGVKVWGTGSATREFLYVEDAAEGVVLAVERYDDSMPVNLGTGIETPIKEVVQLIMELTGFRGSVKWDTSKPDGQPRRRLDVSRAKSFGFVAKTSLREGLRRTIEWYESVRAKGKA